MVKKVRQPPPKQAPHRMGTSMKAASIIVSMLALVCSVSASREGILPLSGFRLESAGIGSSGKVIIEGKQNEKTEILSLKINAFGKEYVVPENTLAQLTGLRPNGVRISYEPGYTELGGRTIYIHFQVGFTSGTRGQALVTLTEDGKVEVSRLEVKATQPEGAAQGNQPSRSETSSTSSAAGSRR